MNYKKKTYPKMKIIEKEKEKESKRQTFEIDMLYKIFKSICRIEYNNSLLYIIIKLKIYYF